KCGRYVLAGARVKARDLAAVLVPAANRLDPDAVPFPFGAEVGRVEHIAPVRRILDRGREHGRMERSGIGVLRLPGAAFDPGEQIVIRRLKPRPDMFDIVRRDAVTETRNGRL